jgi:hypothetical protein
MDVQDVQDENHASTLFILYIHVKFSETAILFESSLIT